MPKMKSHTGMGKRVRFTGSGRIVSEQSGKRHKLEVKPSTRTRRMTGIVEVAKANQRRVRRLLAR
ncbi:MAG: 50S ribosomal protein L35 [Micromonosporaceae bacterium]|nr:50S ribosomal protein L35 [Micromonosporaceae bacterium]